MPRPTRHTVLTQEGWDAEVESNFDIIFDGPLPIHVDTSVDVAAMTTSFPPGNYESCLIILNESGLGTVVSLYLSDGTTWNEIGDAAHTHTGVYSPVIHTHLASEITGAVLAADATLWDGATKTTSTSGPSAGVNGDIHFEHEA